MNFTKLDGFLDKLPSRGIPASQLSITRSGKEVYRKNTGFSDAAGTKPVSDSDTYWYYSVTKVFTCVCALRLIEEGKLKLTDRLCQYIPDFDERITIEHLFTMTAGFDYDLSYARELLASKPDAGTVEIVHELTKKTLLFEPGSHYSYSLCHDILAAVVEVISGMKFRDYVSKIIFTPLGMTDSTFMPTADQLSRLSEMYWYDNSIGKANVISKDNGFRLGADYDSGGAGLLSTHSDVTKFIAALANNGMSTDGYTILKPETLALCETGRLGTEALKDFVQGRLYGYSWGLCGRVHLDPNYSLMKSSVGEFGWDGAAGSFVVIDRAKKTGIIYTQHVQCCVYSYHVLHPMMRNMAFEAVEGEK